MGLRPYLYNMLYRIVTEESPLPNVFTDLGISKLMSKVICIPYG